MPSVHARPTVPKIRIRQLLYNNEKKSHYSPSIQSVYLIDSYCIVRRVYTRHLGTSCTV
jgi:hypothetical protein